jgi:regulator of sirC expression with transglutaminase-like and TPR domain
MNSSEERELKALVSLTDEPDANIYSEIAEKIFAYGKEAIPFLEAQWENTFDSFIQQRIMNILHKIQFDSIGDELENWIKLGYKNIFRAYIIITRFQYPNVDENEIKQKIESICQDIWMEMNEGLTALERVQVINHAFYTIHKFSGNKKNFHSPQNSYLNTVLETHQGNPLSLGMIYMIVANQLKIPIYGINLPEHFILGYTNSIAEDSLDFLDKNEVLFYINPFSNGTVFTRKEVELFIQHLKLEPDEKFFKPCSNLDIIRRLLVNLIFSYQKTENTQKIKELDSLVKIIDKYDQSSTS